MILSDNLNFHRLFEWLRCLNRLIEGRLLRHDRRVVRYDSRLLLLFKQSFSSETLPGLVFYSLGRLINLFDSGDSQLFLYSGSEVCEICRFEQRLMLFLKLRDVEPFQALLHTLTALLVF